MEKRLRGAAHFFLKEVKLGVAQLRNQRRALSAEGWEAFWSCCDEANRRGIMGNLFQRTLFLLGKFPSQLLGWSSVSL